MILLQAQSGTASLIMFGLIFVVMYFFMIRPQIKKQKAENECKELGFTKGTEKFGDCVMKMLSM